MPLPMFVDVGQATAEAGGVPAQVRYNELTLKNAKMIRKWKGGATHWTGKMAKAVERYMPGMRELPSEPTGLASPVIEMQLALCDQLVDDVWHAILTCYDLGKRELEAASEPKTKHQKHKQATAKGKGWGKSSRRHSDTSDSETSSSSSPGSSSLSSSERTPQRRGNGAHASSSGSSVPKPTMVIVDGKEHF